MTPEFIFRILTLLRIKSQNRGRDAFIEVDMFDPRQTFGSMLEVRVALEELEKDGKVEIVKKDSRHFLVRPI